MQIKADPMTWGIVAAVGGVLLLGAWAASRGGIGPAAAAAGQAAGQAAVQAADGLAAGAVGAVGQVAGLPAPWETTTDPRQARWIIDTAGYLEASRWASAGALLQGAMLPAGTGTPPTPGTALHAALAGRVLPQASYDETERLAQRYPAPEPASWWNSITWGTGP